MNIYFSDYFGISEAILEKYDAFNISLINDLPLFIDPFLLFNSKKPEYQQLHEQIIAYVKFLKDKSSDANLEPGLISAWFTFPEVRQSWLGFSKKGNGGQGLREDFANALHRNFNLIFSNFGSEQITRGSHLEKLCLIKEGVGRDKISDFTTNLIKEFLVQYTQRFTQQHLNPGQRQNFVVQKVRFNYKTETWEHDLFDLPSFNGNYVLLTPLDILTKDEVWINKGDLYTSFERIPLAIPNEQLRALVNSYFRSVLPKRPTKEDRDDAVTKTLNEFPILFDYYIREKEKNGESAINVSSEKVELAKKQYIVQIGELAKALQQESGFYQTAGQTYQEAMARIQYLKDVIENKDGYRLFYVQGKPIEREEDLQILYRLTWYATDVDVNREVNNGRGPVDYKVSKGKTDATLVEFKLASNRQLQRNLEKQVAIYQRASDAKQAIKVILYFSATDLNRVQRVLKKLKLDTDSSVVLIDARRDNKPSASKA